MGGDGRQMADVGAVVLTLGEHTTKRALASLASQTLPVGEIAIVDGVRPFHRALHSGVDRISSPYFVQLDSDMVLDADCVEVLRKAIAPGVGIAVGALRDPLMGTIAGVKVFRRSCFDSLRLRDTVSPDTDFYVRLGQLGWLTQYITGQGRHRRWCPTLGEHRPRYTVDYVFGTYYLLGRLYGHRGDARSLRWRFVQLRRSAHPMAPVARLAMARGVLGNETRDVPKPRPGAAESAFLGRLVVSSEEEDDVPGGIGALMALAPESIFAAFRELGEALRSTSPGGLRTCLGRLGGDGDPRSLLSEVALGGGALAAPGTASGMPAVFERLAEAWLGEVAVERAA